MIDETMRISLRRRLFPLGVGFPQPTHGHAQDRRRLLPRPPPPRLRHRPALPLLRPLEGGAAVRGAGASDGGGVLPGLRGLARGRVFHGVPADRVAAVRAGGRRGEEPGRGVGLVAVLRHPHRQPHQAVVPLHHPHLGGLPLRGAHLQQPVAGRRVPALRALLLLRLARHAALHGRHAAAVPARRGRAPDAVLRRQGPEDPAAAAAVPADAAPVVPAVAVDAVRVPEGRAGQPRGARARVLPPVPALLPPALRRDFLPRQDAPPARRPHIHRRRQVQAEAGAAAAAAASPRWAPPPAPLPAAAEDLILVSSLHGDQRIFLHTP
uniref:Uncharacterized protein n=1 Tax=Zea mays TaxID=4577 RepID=B7ZY59_MAIZE|nr:unknown [Zea mays]